MILLAQILFSVIAALILGVLALVWTIIRMALTFLVGISALGAAVGLGGWELTGNPNLWAMFVKCGIAALSIGLLLAGALNPGLWLWSEPRPSNPQTPVAR